MPRYQNPLVKTDRVNVWRLKEKKTDVNIALNLYRDAYKGVEQLVLVSNDSDISRHWKRYRKIFRKSEPPRHHAAYETR